MFTAAFEMEYGAEITNSVAIVTSRSPDPLEIVTTFFAFPFLSSGRKMLIVWMTPMTLTLNYRDLLALPRMPRAAWVAHRIHEILGEQLF
jgi:hypothetical protein